MRPETRLQAEAEGHSVGCHTTALYAASVTGASIELLLVVLVVLVIVGQFVRSTVLLSSISAE